MIPFKQIPANIRVPLFYAEVDPSQANTAVQAQRTLLIGQLTVAGTITPNVPVISQSIAEAKASTGPGSILAAMTAVYRANDSFGEVWYLPLADDPGAPAATGAVLFAGPTTAAGTVNLYVAGQLVSVALGAATTAAGAAAAVVAAINAASDLPVTAAVDGVTTAKVDLTAKNKGAAANDIDIRLNYRGAAGGEVLPAGLTATVTAMAGGAVNPSLTTALANLLDEPFDFIISPYTDAASIAAISALLNDTTGRWSWQTQVYGHCFIAKRGTLGTLGTFGAGVNDQHLSCIGFNDSPSPNWAWAAAFAGAAAVSLRADPGVPLQTIPVVGILAPPLVSRFSLSQRNTLLYGAISTFRVDSAANVAVENLITTYQTNPLGQSDNSYLEVETLYLLAYVLRRMASVITSKYARVKLADDGTRVGPGTGIVTPSTIRADLIAMYRQMESEGYVEGSTAFAAGIVVARNAANPNRVDVLWPGNLIGQLRVLALLAQFRL